SGRIMLLHAIPVLLGKRTWTGYPAKAHGLPAIPVPVFPIADTYHDLDAHPDWQQLLYERYALNYEASRDLQVLWEVIRKGHEH
ncbi:MAG: hypothetical protein RL160_1, partial [Bacteroidota bacterium]